MAARHPQSNDRGFSIGMGPPNDRDEGAPEIEARRIYNASCYGRNRQTFDNLKKSILTFDKEYIIEMVSEDHDHVKGVMKHIFLNDFYVLDRFYDKPEKLEHYFLELGRMVIGGVKSLDEATQDDNYLRVILRQLVAGAAADRWKQYGCEEGTYTVDKASLLCYVYFALTNDDRLLAQYGPTPPCSSGVPRWDDGQRVRPAISADVVMIGDPSDV